MLTGLIIECEDLDEILECQKYLFSIGFTWRTGGQEVSENPMISYIMTHENDDQVKLWPGYNYTKTDNKMFLTWSETIMQKYIDSDFKQIKFSKLKRREKVRRLL